MPSVIAACAGLLALAACAQPDEAAPSLPTTPTMTLIGAGDAAFAIVDP